MSETASEAPGHQGQEDQQAPQLKAASNNSPAASSAPAQVASNGTVHMTTAEQDKARQNGPLESTLLEYFQHADKDGNGSLSFDEFAAVFTPDHLGVNLSQDDLKALFDIVDEDKSGSINYAEFVPRARDALVQKLAAASETEGEWIEIYSRTEGILYLNKTTGKAQYDLPDSYTASEDEIVADAFASHFMLRDPKQTGLVDFNTFCIDLQTDTLGLFLTAEEVEAIVQVHPPVDEEGTMNYMSLAPLMRNYVTQLYAGRDPIPGHWVRLVTRHYGTFWLNKMTGTVQADVPLEVILAAQAAQGGIVPPVVEGTSAADAQRIRELTEEVERLKQQQQQEGGGGGGGGSGGDGGGGASEEAKQKIEELQKTIESQASDLAALRQEREALSSTQSDEQNALSDALAAKHELEKELAQTKDAAASEQERLSKRLKEVTAKATALQSELDETKSAFEASRSQCETQAGELKTLKAKAKALEEKAKEAEQLATQAEELREQLQETKQLSDERSKTLATQRAQIKNLKEKTSKADKDAEQMERVREQLHEQREMYRTTKAFLDSKTKIIQQKNEHIRLLQEKVSALEQQDEKRAQILESLLERTSSLQAQMAEPDASLALEAATPSRRRTHSTSPVGAGRTRRGSGSGHTDANGYLRSTPGKTPSRGTRRSSRGGKGTVSFPPISRGSVTSQPLNIDHELKLEEEDVAACHVRVGDRVLVRGPLVDGVVKQYTGMVKYVGRLDSEVADYSIYAGLKMDDAIGDTDGLFKGKRYFKCPERHGRFVPITDIISVVASRAPRRRTGVRQETRSMAA